MANPKNMSPPRSGAAEAPTKKRVSRLPDSPPEPLGETSFRKPNAPNLDYVQTKRAKKRLRQQEQQGNDQGSQKPDAETPKDGSYEPSRRKGQGSSKKRRLDDLSEGNDRDQDGQAEAVGDDDEDGGYVAESIEIEESREYEEMWIVEGKSKNVESKDGESKEEKSGDCETDEQEEEEEKEEEKEVQGTYRIGHHPGLHVTSYASDCPKDAVDTTSLPAWIGVKDTRGIYRKISTTEDLDDWECNQRGSLSRDAAEGEADALFQMQKQLRLCFEQRRFLEGEWRMMRRIEYLEHNLFDAVGYAMNQFDRYMRWWGIQVLPADTPTDQ